MEAAIDVRMVGRSAVRERLARVAFDRFCATGFDRVTFADLAAATGVSRSTFLRYFENKEDVVLFVFDPIAERVVSALRRRSGSRSQWVSLRDAFTAAAEALLVDAAETRAFLRLVQDTPALRAAFRDKQGEWRRGIATALSDGNSEVSNGMRSLESAVVAAAIGCFAVALEQWDQPDEQRTLVDLVHDAFAAVSGADVELTG